MNGNVIGNENKTVKEDENVKDDQQISDIFGNTKEKFEDINENVNEIVDYDDYDTNTNRNDKSKSNESFNE